MPEILLLDGFNNKRSDKMSYGTIDFLDQALLDPDKIKDLLVASGGAVAAGALNTAISKNILNRIKNDTARRVAKIAIPVVGGLILGNLLMDKGQAMLGTGLAAGLIGSAIQDVLVDFKIPGFNGLEQVDVEESDLLLEGYDNVQSEEPLVSQLAGLGAVSAESPFLQDELAYLGGVAGM